MTYDNVFEALLALASPQEAREFAADFALPIIVDGYGDEQRVEPRHEPALLARLMELLRSGELIASGFGYERGQPTELSRLLWQRMIINVVNNSAHDERAWPGRKSETGSFHSLSFRRVRQTPPQPARNVRDETITELIELFEELDTQLPKSHSKKHFFHIAEEKLGARAVETWMRVAWTSAKLRPPRRSPGARKIESI